MSYVGTRKLEGKKPLAKPGLRWEGNIKMDINLL
jgi:hypothetical protein